MRGPYFPQKKKPEPLLKIGVKKETLAYTDKNTDSNLNFLNRYLNAEERKKLDKMAFQKQELQYLSKAYEQTHMKNPNLTKKKIDVDHISGKIGQENREEQFLNYQNSGSSLTTDQIANRQIFKPDMRSINYHGYNIINNNILGFCDPNQKFPGSSYQNTYLGKQLPDESIGFTPEQYQEYLRLKKNVVMNKEKEMKGHLVNMKVPGRGYNNLNNLNEEDRRRIANEQRIMREREYNRNVQNLALEQRALNRDQVNYFNYKDLEAESKRQYDMYMNELQKGKSGDGNFGGEQRQLNPQEEQYLREREEYERYMQEQMRQNPQMMDPRMMQNPEMMDPRMMQNPEMDPRMMQNPQMMDPRLIQNPEMDTRMINNPQMNDPKLIQTPEMMDPRMMKNPGMMDPRMIQNPQMSPEELAYYQQIQQQQIPMTKPQNEIPLSQQEQIPNSQIGKIPNPEDKKYKKEYEQYLISQQQQNKQRIQQLPDISISAEKKTPNPQIQKLEEKPKEQINPNEGNPQSESDRDYMQYIEYMRQQEMQNPQLQPQLNNQNQMLSQIPQENIPYREVTPSLNFKKEELSNNPNSQIGNPQLKNPNPQLVNSQLKNPTPQITNQNTQLINPTSELINPQLSNPQLTNPQLTNLQLTNPQLTNPQLTNPQLTNPQLTNPQMINPSSQLTNAQIPNPQLTNPQISNPELINQPPQLNYNEITPEEYERMQYENYLMEQQRQREMMLLQQREQVDPEYIKKLQNYESIVQDQPTINPKTNEESLIINPSKTPSYHEAKKIAATPNYNLQVQGAAPGKITKGNMVIGNPYTTRNYNLGDSNLEQNPITHPINSYKFDYNRMYNPLVNGGRINSGRLQFAGNSVVGK